MAAGTAPYWTYWMWGLFGLGLLYYGYKSITFIDNTGKQRFDLLAFFECLFGIFLLVYWADKIGLI